MYVGAFPFFDSLVTVTFEVTVTLQKQRPPGCSAVPGGRLSEELRRPSAVLCGSNLTSKNAKER